MYAVKVARKGTSCGDGATGGMGFLKQARMQQLASEYGVTPPVDAVYCGHKKEVSFMVMPVLAHRVVDVYKRGSELSEKHQKQIWNLYKTLDTKVGIMHNDLNCLNIMIDGKDNVKLIDFDRSKVIEKKHIKKWGPYINISFLDMVNCFGGPFTRGISPGEKLIKNYLRVHGSLDNYDSFVKNKKNITFSHIRPHLRNSLVLRKSGITNWCDKKGSGTAHNPSNCAMQFKFRMLDWRDQTGHDGQTHRLRTGTRETTVPRRHTERRTRHRKKWPEKKEPCQQNWFLKYIWNRNELDKLNKIVGDMERRNAKNVTRQKELKNDRETKDFLQVKKISQKGLRPLFQERTS